MAHFIVDGNPTNLIRLGSGGEATVDLFGDGPRGERLEVAAFDPTLFTVTELQASVGSDLRRFTLRGLTGGSSQIVARIGAAGPSWAQSRVIVDRRSLFRYYHGTNNDIANLLVGVDLTPMLLSQLNAALVTAFDWTDYTDFGKGFYVHVDENKRMAWEWAKRRFGSDWAVVEFIASDDELRDLWPTALHFADKSDRPRNAPRPITVTTTR